MNLATMEDSTSSPVVDQQARHLPVANCWNIYCIVVALILWLCGEFRHICTDV